jgi:hypothetical protein
MDYIACYHSRLIDLQILAPIEVEAARLIGDRIVVLILLQIFN